MIPSDQSASRNQQTAAGSASATQINDAQAPIFSGGKRNNYYLNYGVAAVPKRSADGIAHNLPFRSAIAFVGRQTELKQLHQALQQKATVAICSIQGMGGIGKTELALQYAHAHLEQQDYPGGVCWLNAREDVGIQIVAFARSQFPLDLPDNLNLAGHVAFCWRHWEAGKVLLVLDDVQNYAAIKPLFQGIDARFKILLTTRSRLGASVQEVAIEVLSEETALGLLRSLVMDERIDRELTQAKQLCEWLGYLPLGLELVGRYLAEDPGVSVTTLWQRLQKKRLATAALQEAYPGMTAEAGVAAAFELSWETLPEEAQQVAKLLSLFALSEIPWKLVQQCLPKWDEEDLEVLRNRKLVNANLLTRTEAGEFRLHQLLREFFASKISATECKELKTAFATTMVEIAREIPPVPTLEQIQAVRTAIPHLRELAADLIQLKTKEDLYLQEDYGLLLVFTGISWFYEGQGLYADAEPWKKDCFAVVRSLLGEQHSYVAQSLNNLANLYRAQGRYAEAEPLLLQALELRRSLLGEQHSDVAQSLNNLAELYRAQGQYTEAEPLLLQALELRRSLLGDQHTDVAQSLNNLAELYRAQGRYKEAEPLFLQALELRRSRLGDQQLDVATSLNDLAALYWSQGRYEEAEPLFLQALEAYRSQLGEAHPYVVISLNNLALLYRDQERYEEAEPLFLQALELCQSRLGNQHPYLATNWDNLAGLYDSQGRYEEAEPLFLQALELRRSLLGEEHPDVAQSQNNLAVLYYDQGRLVEAEPLFVQALELRQRRLGNRHPDTVKTRQWLAIVRQEMG
ncbi:MAG: tetratricopeptide repeat protein [Phormidium tanganyikae FI6-MK23]|jgi:tetratricopeptide (TPR) repeat protein|nr:tetratricopeptide repeat protein [Phormidium tanganyikae FI6-MK23]